MAKNRNIHLGAHCVADQHRYRIPRYGWIVELLLCIGDHSAIRHCHSERTQVAIWTCTRLFAQVISNCYICSGSLQRSVRIMWGGAVVQAGMWPLLVYSFLQAVTFLRAFLMIQPSLLDGLARMDGASSIRWSIPLPK